MWRCETRHKHFACPHKQHGAMAGAAPGAKSAAVDRGVLGVTAGATGSHCENNDLDREE